MTFQFKTATAAAGISAALLAGWLIGGGWNAVIAQTTRDVRSRQPTSATRAVSEAPQPVPCWGMYDKVVVTDGHGTFFVDHCAGKIFKLTNSGEWREKRLVPLQ